MPQNERNRATRRIPALFRGADLEAVEKRMKLAPLPASLISPKDAAELLGVARHIIYEAIERRAIRGFRANGRVFIPQRDIDVYRKSYARGRPSAVIGPAQDIGVGHRMRLIRDALGITQTDMAKRLATSQSTVKNLENNLRHARHEMLLKYADLVGVSVDWILTGEPATIQDRHFVASRKRR